MEEVTLRELDSQGRISIPARWRKEWKSNKLILVKREGKIKLMPIETTSPSNLFDSIELPESVDFTDPHSLKSKR